MRKQPHSCDGWKTSAMRHIVHLILPLLMVLLASSSLTGCCHEVNRANCEGGTELSQLGAFDGIVRSVRPIGDGSSDVYVAGDFTEYRGTPTHSLIRLHADGSVAMSFPEGFDQGVEALALANNGSGDLYAVGAFTQYNQQSAPHIVRLHADGSLDTGFQPFLGFDQPPLQVVPAEDGSGDIYLGGRFTSYNGLQVSRLVRVNADGSLDPSFVVGTGFEGPLDFPVEVRALAAAPNGKLYAGGAFSSYDGIPMNGLIRLNPDGRPDPTFITGTGIVTTAAGGVQVIAPARDGTQDVYVGGQIETYNGQPVTSGLLRLNDTGGLDRLFIPSTIFVFALAPLGDANGDVYVGGRGSSETGPTDRFIRLRRDGALAADFQEPRLLAEGILTIALAEDGTGDVYVGGASTVYNDVLIQHLARVHADGRLKGSLANLPTARQKGAGI